jgi:D-sedoheptulose 7-phosphate isomerase
MTKEIENLIIARLEENIMVKQVVGKTLVGKIKDIAEAIIATYKLGGKVVLFGNGGSAADAQHIAGELVGKFMLERRPFPAITLNENPSVITAIANDSSFEEVFSRQVQALVEEKDCVIGISTSGQSVNVIQGLETAKGERAVTVALVGCNGGELAKIADIALVVPSYSTPRIQEAHITIGHIICELVENELEREKNGN